MLSYIQIQCAKPAEKTYDLRDDKGLFLRVKPNGKKFWLVSKQINGKRITKTLGYFPELGIKEARELFNNLCAVYDTQSSVSAITFNDIYNEWLDLKKTQIKNWRDSSLRIEKYLMPVFKERIYASIAPIEFINTLKSDLAQRSKFETIKRICGYIREIEVYALNCGYVSSLKFQNIANVFPAPQTTLNNRPAIHYSELPIALKELQIYGLKARATWEVILCGFYTLLRPSEYCSLKWEWIDFDTLTITIPAETMKMKRAHTVPISKQLLALLQARPRIGEFVFPMTQGKITQHFCINAASLFLRRHGYKDRLVPHGIRSIGRTWFHDNDIAFDVAEKCLAHNIGNTTQLAYDRTDLLEKRRGAMQLWCDFVEECLR